MQREMLCAKERAAMFALLAEAREVANPELEERVGFRLDGKERRRLNDLKLVTSEKRGSSYVHELTDGGWRWCYDELSAGPGEGRGSKDIERAFYAILAGLRRYLEVTQRSLAEIFKPLPEAQPLEQADIEKRITDEYNGLASESGDFAKLRELRQRLPDIARADVDAALDRMYRSQRINLVPQADQQALSDADRESALRIGGEYKHLISIGQL
jgi:hypothetical protein